MGKWEDDIEIGHLIKSFFTSSRNLPPETLLIHLWLSGDPSSAFSPRLASMLTLNGMSSSRAKSKL